MPKRKLSRLNPRLTYVVVSGDRSITPAFFHKELAVAAQRELSSENETLEVKEVPSSHAPDDSFDVAVDVMSREGRWLQMSKNDKRAFSALCEGWASIAGNPASKTTAELA